jgi:hypothetical protein
VVQRYVPGAITVSPAGDAQALAVLISNANADSGRAARLKLRDLLSVTRIVDEHLGLYRNLRHIALQEADPP